MSASSPTIEAAPARRRVAALLAAGAVAAGLGLLAAPAQAAPRAITGTVTFAGSPRSGVTVGTYDPMTRATTAVRTGPHGTYRLPVPGYRYVLYADIDVTRQYRGPQLKGSVAEYRGAGSRTSYAYQTIAPAALASGPRVADFHLPRAAVVSGVSAALAKKVVYLETDDGARVAGRTTADAHGRYSFRAVPGRFRLAADAPSHALLRSSSTVFTARSGHRTVVDLHPGRATVVRGRVTYQGKAVKGVLVHLTRADGSVLGAVTSRLGTYAFGGRLTGDAALTIGTVGDVLYDDRVYIPQQHRVAGLRLGTTRTVDARLVRGGDISSAFDLGPTARNGDYEIVDARTGDAVSSGGLNKPDIGTLARVDAHGLATGDYRVVVTDSTGYVGTADPGAARYSVQTVHVTAGRATQLGTVTATLPTVTLHGHVPGGGTASSVVLTGPFQRWADVDASGDFTIHGLVPSTYHVEVRDAFHRDAAVNTVVTGDTTATYPLGAAVGRVGGEVQLVSNHAQLGGELTLSDGATFATHGYEEEGFGHSITAGTYSITHVTGDAWFQPNTPYHFRVVDGHQRFTVVAGASTELGVIPVEVVP